MANLAAMLEELAGDEPIVACVVVRRDYGSWPCKSKALPWAEAKAQLNFDFKNGYGAGLDIGATAWTDSLILATTEYDGCMGAYSLPRNPPTL